jgi:hypothetical protein
MFQAEPVPHALVLVVIGIIGSPDLRDGERSGRSPTAVPVLRAAASGCPEYRERTWLRRG